MRLWHQDLLTFLPRAQILGQHRECCALRGMGWGKKHSTVDYVFTYSAKRLVDYHQLVLKEMERRGYKPAQQWSYPEYRGKNCMPWSCFLPSENYLSSEALIYPEHDEAYREECLENLRQKGVEISPHD
ncbi:MAG TPA: TIGR02328 family protein [Desulfosporosinus sp.]|nr:TIGR02328 family protein [Desulfosporosinus sp.]